MWYKNLKEIADDIIKNARLMKQSGKKGESAEVEEHAKEIESVAGSIVAAMQNEGIYVGYQIGGSEGSIITTKEPL